MLSQLCDVMAGSGELDVRDVARYSRQLLLPEWGRRGEPSLAGKSARR